MKIGILTYHRTLNYGACLQAIATRVTLEKMGHNAYYLDYWPLYHQDGYKAFSWKKFKSKKRIAEKVRYIISIGYRAKRNKNFQGFLQKFILQYCKPQNDEYDAIIYGSDQIWRKQSALNRYNPIYFAKNDFKSHRHIAYSASMGILPSNEEDRKIIKPLLNNFDAISVREKDLQELLFSLGINQVPVTLDPTLLLQSKEWDMIIPTEPYQGPKYVLVYGITSQIPFDIKEINTFAKERGYIVKKIWGTAEKADKENELFTANTFEFLRLLKNSEFVFTSSFHGLAFSIIYEKEFFASYKKNSNRAQSLLSALEIEGRIIADKQPIPNQFSPINYSQVSNKKKTMIKKSLDYLVQTLSQNV